MAKTALATDDNDDPNKSRATADSERVAPSPITGYALSKDEQSRGGRVSQERARERRERAKLTFEEILREEWEAEAREYARQMIRLGKESGDVPTFKAVTDRLYGTPTSRQEVEDVTERTDTPVDLDRIRELQAKARGLKAA